MSFGAFASILFSLAIGALVVFFGLHWLQVPVGSLVDWLIGIAVVWWLATVTTLPWNAHFAALAVVQEAQASREKGIAINEAHVAYAGRIAARFRTLAVALHVLTAAVLAELAYFHVTALGYPAAVAALALTFARPAARAYEHLAERLRLMQHQVHYPREDVLELRNRVQELEAQLKTVNTALDETETDSWAHQLAQARATMQRHLDRLDATVEELTRQNARDHEALARQTA